MICSRANCARACLICLVMLFLSLLVDHISRPSIMSTSNIRRGSGTKKHNRWPYGELCASSRRTILVTGAAGFIGFHASIALQKQTGNVVGIDNFNAYYPVSLKIERASFLRNAGIPVLRVDVTDYTKLLDVFNSCHFTHVLHLAAQAGVRYASKNPFAYINSNVAGSLTLLEVMKLQPNIPKLIYASSSSVYGNRARLPFTEKERTDFPASLYAATKRSQELITQSYHSMYGISCTGLRFFTVYGPYGRPDMSIISFALKILHDQPITVFRRSDGKDLSRDFTYIDDVVRGIVGAFQAIDMNDNVPKHVIFNLGNSEVVPVSYLVDKIGVLLSKTASIHYVPAPSSEVVSTYANISAAQKTFRFNPKTSVETGLSLTIHWLLSIRNTSLFRDLSLYTTV